MTHQPLHGLEVASSAGKVQRLPTLFITAINESAKLQRISRPGQISVATGLDEGSG